MGQEIDWGSFTATSLSNIEIPEMSPGTPDLSQVSLRTNLQETAFFFPELTSDDEGKVRMSFTMLKNYLPIMCRRLTREVWRRKW